MRANVASNPNTSWPTMETLAWEFPHVFLHNPVGPLQMIANSEQISTDKAFWEAVLREAPIPEGWANWLSEAVQTLLFSALAAEWNSLAIRNAFARANQEGYAGGYRPLLAPFLPSIVLQKLAASPYWKMRYLIALHEQTSWETRQCLCQDGNRYVRAVARAKAQTYHFH